MYLLQKALWNDYVLFIEHMKLTLLQFHVVAYEAFIYFNAEDWPAYEEEW